MIRRVRAEKVRQLCVAGYDRADRVGRVRRLHQVAEGEQVGQEVDHDVVEHDRGDHLVRAGPGLELADQPAERRAAHETADHADHGVHEQRQADPVAEVRGDDHAADELALRADVEQARLVGQRDRQTGQDQRRGLDAGLRQRVEDGGQVAVVDRRADRRLLEQRRDRVRVDDRSLEHLHVGAHRGIPGRRDGMAGSREEVTPGVQHGGVRERVQQPAYHERAEEDQDDDGERMAFQDRVPECPAETETGPEPPRPLLPRGGWIRGTHLVAHCPAPGMAVGALGVGSGPGGSVSWSAPPAISSPSSSVGTVGGRKPVILPSYMTAMRSARA